MHPVARTRALYNWEHGVLDNHPNNMPLVDEGVAQELAITIWMDQGWDKHEKCPTVHFIDSKELSHCLGRADVYLTSKNHRHLGELIHELVHARGYGSVKNPHNVYFVRKYVELLTKYVWTDVLPDSLFYYARQRRLV